jgi:hypothetical protein
MSGDRSHSKLALRYNTIQCKAKASEPRKENVTFRLDSEKKTALE